MNQITSPNAPKALGPYSQAIETENFIFCSGQIGIDPKNGQLVSENIQEQTKQVLENLQNILRAAKSDFTKIVRCDVFLTNLNDFSVFNQIYESFFEQAPYPARQTVEVSALPKNAKVEISCIAIK